MDSRTCKECKLVLEMSKFGPRRAVCMKCAYAKNKDYLTSYYKENRKEIIARVMEIYWFILLLNNVAKISTPIIINFQIMRGAPL